MKALIVEDEPRAQRILENLLRTNFPEVEVIGITASVKETLSWLSSHKADVIFMDVELSDGNCFDIFSQAEVDAQVVMTTAYDDYAVDAFKVNSLDYLLKPVDVEDLQRAVERVKQRLAQSVPAPVDMTRVQETFQASQAEETAVPSAKSSGPHREKFLIRLNDRIVPVHVHNIAYFYSEAKNSYIVTKNGVNYVLDDSLDTIEAGLDPKSFFRISRSVIVAESVIDSVSKLLGGRLRLSLVRDIPAETDLTVSRARADAFLEWLEG
jgi:DNA-binding LytR/AlgR family response regulator